MKNIIHFLVISALAVFYCGNPDTQKLHRADLKNVPICDMHIHPIHPNIFNPENMRGDELKTKVIDKALNERIAAMDASGVRKCVLLCTGYGKEYPNLEHKRSEKVAFYYLGKEQERVIVFTTVDFSRMDSADFSEKAVGYIEKMVREGARGLKFELGKPAVHWMPMDDSRLDPIYDKTAELGLPITYHTNDPEEFFQPANKFNWWNFEEGSEQTRDNKKYFYPMSYWGKLDEYVSREQLLCEQESMFHKHPNTTFIMAHMGFLSRQLPLLADIFDRYPNVYVDISATLPNLCRTPIESRAFMIDYADRFLFVSDQGNPPQAQWERFWKAFFRLLESDEKDFPSYAPRAFNVSGLNLPKNVLEKIYYKNAETLLARPVKII